MRILQIIPGKTWGGIEQLILDLGEELTKRGHQITYLARKNTPVVKRLGESVPVQTWRVSGAYDLPAAIHLSRLMRKVRPDVVHVHYLRTVPVVIMARWLSGIPSRVIFTRHAARRSRTIPFWRGALRRLHCMTFVSDIAQRLWFDVNTWMPRERYRVIHNSIRTNNNTEVQAEGLREHFGLAPTTPLVVFVGRIEEYKGCRTIIRAAARLRDLNFRIIFIGSCHPLDYIEQLQAMAKNMDVDDRILFYGFSNCVQSLIRQADIGLSPSIVCEACPLTPIEFMQAGKLVITSNNGAQPEYIRSGETGVLVPPDDDEQLAQAIRKALVDVPYRERIGRLAAEYFQQHMSYDHFVEQFLDCYEAH